MTKKREFAVDSATLDLRAGPARPFSPIEALMMAPPDGAIETSQLELLALRDVLQDALETQLSPLELYVFNGLVVEKRSLRALERQLHIPKTSVARIRDKALEKLRLHLQENPTVQAHLERT